MAEKKKELPEINKRIREIIDNDYKGNVLKFSRSIGLNNSSKVNRLFNLDKRNNDYPDVSIDILQRICNTLGYSADNIIKGTLQKENKNTIEDNNKNESIVSDNKHEHSNDYIIKYLLDIVKLQQIQINKLL